MAELQLCEGLVPMLRTFLLITLMLCAARAARAQDRLFALVPTFGVLELETAGSSLGQVKSMTPLPPHSASAPVLVGGGRYMVWAVSPEPRLYWLAVYDLRLRLGQVLPGVQFRSEPSIVADPLSSRVFVGIGGADSLLEIGVGSAQQRLIPYPGVGLLLAYSPQGDFLVIRNERGLVDLVETTGNVRHTVPVDSAVAAVVDPTGKRLFIVAESAATNRMLIAHYDVERVVVDNTATLPYSLTEGQPLRHTHRLTLDDVRNRLVILARSTEGFRVLWLAAFDASTLRMIGIEARGPKQADASASLLIGGPRSPYYLLQRDLLNFTGCPSNEMSTVDPSRGLGLVYTNPRAEWSRLGIGGACHYWPLLVSAPSVPLNIRSIVAGSNVLLTWDQAGTSSRFEVSAGLTPDATPVAITLEGPRLLVTDVPRGRYFVRVRATNEAGVSARSTALEVVVP